MENLIPQTALRGRSQSRHDRLATNLGYFSIALGVAEMIAPRAICRTVGLDGLESLVRSYGAREIANGVAILASHDPAPWIWGRVAGDLADIATVATQRRRDHWTQRNNVLALFALAAVTAVDVICATGLSAEKGGRKTALADYHNRSGYPRGLEAARGAARSFQAPKDMKIPEPLRPLA
jgi:hypothetical protein